MELFEISTVTVAMVEYKDVLFGLVAVNRQHEGKETGTHSGLIPDEKMPIIKCPMMVRAHGYPITGFMFR